MGNAAGTRVHLLVDRASSSLWPVPAAMVLGAVALSSGLLQLDRALGTDYHAGQWWLFGGNARGARTLLSVIAGSLITVVSVAFSVTIVAIQQASTQYSPRVLRNYTKDRGNQFVLGLYMATFAYSLLVLREVREAGDAGGGGFVPTWSILGAMLLALASLGALIYFVHHVAESLQVDFVLTVIRREVDRETERLFPEPFGRRAHDLREREDAPREHGAAALVVACEQEGYLRAVDEQALARACAGLELAVVPVQVGERLQRDTVLLRAWAPGGSPLDPADTARRADSVRAAFRLDRQRTTDQDVLFGLRQMVDIAVKALSPGINDPTTAERALAEIVGSVAVLLRREMPAPRRRLDGRTRFVFTVPTFDDIVEEGFSQIRRAARTHQHVTLALLDGLALLAARAPADGRARPLRLQARLVLEGLAGAGFVAHDEARVRRAAARVLVELGAGPSPDAGRAPSLH